MVFGNKLGINTALLSCRSQPLNLYWAAARERETQRVRETERGQDGSVDRETEQDKYSYPSASMPRYIILARPRMRGRQTDCISPYSERQGEKTEPLSSSEHILFLDHWSQKSEASGLEGADERSVVLKLFLATKSFFEIKAPTELPSVERLHAEHAFGACLWSTPSEHTVGARYQSTPSKHAIRACHLDTSSEHAIGACGFLLSPPLLSAGQAASWGPSGLQRAPLWDWSPPWPLCGRALECPWFFTEFRLSLIWEAPEGIIG